MRGLTANKDDTMLHYAITSLKGYFYGLQRVIIKFQQHQ
ncbi:hypothetical protein DOT_2004 [Desulfosporosinus sp. OT]|nr:hypothetical protein DOT_2004 [Desulfosporosinus sp. OT]